MKKGLRSIDDALKKAESSSDASGCIIMREIPTENYFEDNVSAVKNLTDKGFDGIYLSFQRPYDNISSTFEHDGIDMNKVLVIDAAAAFTGEKQSKDKHCIPISEEIEVDELVKAIYQSLPKLKSKKRFIYIDSLTTIALYKPLSETMRFSEFLVNTIRRDTDGNVALIFNVSKDLTQKKFIKDVAFRVDDVVAS